MKIKSTVLLTLITAAALTAVAVYNGFPLTEQDTGAYIQQAIYPHFAVDRTPFYGLFLRVTSLWTSLWYTIYMQSLLLAFLIVRYIRLHFDQQRLGAGITLLTAVAIVALTCVPWVTAYLMPDIFAGILLLAILLYLAARGARIMQLIYLAIIFLALLMHNSHFLITILFASILLIAAMIKKQKALAKRYAALIAVSVLVWATLCSINAVKKNGFVFSRGSNMFLMAKFAETGILSMYLNETSDKQHYKICAYQNNIPTTFNDFLWSDQSPLYKMGGWDSCRKEYGLITGDVLRKRVYALLFAKSSLTSTAVELTQVNITDKVPGQGNESEPMKKVRQYFSDQLAQFNSSRQNRNVLHAGACNNIYTAFFLFSSAWILFFFRRIRSREVYFIYSCILLFLLVNACVTATFSTVIYRFQYRIFWILPATNAIMIIKYYTRYLPLKTP